MSGKRAKAVKKAAAKKKGAPLKKAQWAQPVDKDGRKEPAVLVQHSEVRAAKKAA